MVSIEVKKKVIHGLSNGIKMNRGEIPGERSGGDTSKGNANFTF